MSPLPYDGIRIIESSETVAGRLAGLLFADQGAEVFVERAPGHEPDDQDEYFDRNKTALPPGALADTSSADIIIVDGDAEVDRQPAQITLRITAALPGDEAYGHLDANCSEDLINALVGFFTDMGTTARSLGRPVIYTPLPLSSVYTGVAGAIAAASAMVDRARSGQGREVTASRIAGGLTAIGAMSFTTEGLADHHAMADAAGLPEGMSIEEFKAIVAEASVDASKQLWLEQRIIPLASPHVCADGRMIQNVCMINRRLAQRLFKELGISEAVLEAGMVDVSPYDPANLVKYPGLNIADSVSLNYPMSSKLAELIAEAFKRKPAAEWEKQMCEAGIPVGIVNSFEEWLSHPHARASGVVADVEGHDHVQIGRSVWIGSAQPYPALRSCEGVEALPDRAAPSPQTNGQQPAARPLEGFTLVDFTNVVAGPNSGRMFAELGATVYWICPYSPQHSPVVMVAYTSESGVGKQSIILDMSKDQGREIMNKIVARADMVLANKLDSQMERMGLDRKSLDQLNPALIGIQLSAYRGEIPSARQNWPGYDPVAQAFTGIMDRFGPEGCPTFHGVASCVDYLCGYLGTWAGVTALQARERRQDGIGDWAEASLATAATLTQCTLQQTQLPESAQGPYATGMNDSERVYQLSDGWIFAQGDRDLSDDLASSTVEQALATLSERGIQAVPVQTCRELADRHRANPSRTVAFEKRDESHGWVTENFAPTWFTFDGESVPCPGAPQRVGSEATEILAEFGYSSAEVERLVSDGVVGQTEWAHIREQD